MATVLKTVVAARSPGVRIPLPPPAGVQRSLVGVAARRAAFNKRMSGGGAGVDDRGRLLSGCGVKSSTQGSNPCLPAFSEKHKTLRFSDFFYDNFYL